MTKVKICGITNIEDAIFAAQQGANFIGFIFYPQSSRYITPENAAFIVKQVRRKLGNSAPRFVGVFVDAISRDLMSIKAQVGLDLLQLHGAESPDLVLHMQPGAFKAICPHALADAIMSVERYRQTLTDIPDYPQLLVDAYHPTEKGGTGLQADMHIAELLSRRYRLLLAGGLNPCNVGAVIQAVRPWGVDVSSGVEMICDGVLMKGKKDPNKVAAFVQAVHTTSIQTTNLL